MERVALVLFPHSPFPIPDGCPKVVRCADKTLNNPRASGSLDDWTVVGRSGRIVSRDIECGAPKSSMIKSVHIEECSNAAIAVAEV